MFDNIAPGTLVEVRCCCQPDNLVGHISYDVGIEHGLQLRETEPFGFAFDTNHDAEGVKALPTFTENKTVTWRQGTVKTWKK